MNGAMIFVDFEFQAERGMPLKLIEIGAVRIHNGEVATFSSLVRQKGIQAEVLAFTRIQREQLQKAPLYQDVSEQFIEFAGNAPTFIFFSSQDREIFYANRFWEELVASSRLIDYQEKLMVHLNELRKPSLVALLAQYDVQHEVQHRALSDAEALRKLYIASNGDAIIEAQQTTKLFAPFVRRSFDNRRETISVTLYEYDVLTKDRQTYTWHFIVPQQEVEVEIELSHSGLLSSMRTTVIEKQLLYGRTAESEAAFVQINEQLTDGALFAPSERCGLMNVFFDYGMTLRKCTLLPYYLLEGHTYNKEQTERVSKMMKNAHYRTTTLNGAIFDVLEQYEDQLLRYMTETALI
ncbi:3'-5' exonuclease [Caryophanon latum]|uniref:Exonuclease domain-containing protein n=1 Tax=Caryophanon latum TaxID=33977 RepID=A0A1C0YHT2_9BACL|nr:3'-5' exonuclease [Caryophanon latum]OCS86701.1 hypothetical protein A6K76_14425 [Caryophanon latum]